MIKINKIRWQQGVTSGVFFPLYFIIEETFVLSVPATAKLFQADMLECLFKI